MRAQNDSALPSVPTEKRLDHPGLTAPKTLSTELADRLCDRIRNDRLAPGARLGTEAEIGEEFGVSRTVVREAIGCLRGLGVVAGRQRLGLFVARGDIRSVLERALSPRAADEKGWQELRQIRVVIELGSIPMAVERASEEQVSRLVSLAAEMRTLMKSYATDPDGVRNAFDAKDMQFHQTVLEAAHDDLASRFHNVLVECFRVDDMCGALPTLAVARQHERIAKAIAKRDTAAAVQHCNAVPVVADVDPNTWTLDVDDLRRKLTDRTKAIIPVSIAGLMPDMDPIMALVDELVEMRCRSAQALAAVVDQCDWLIPQTVPGGYTHTYWTYMVRLDRDDVDWAAFRRTFVDLGGDGFYGAYCPVHSEEMFANLTAAIQETPDRYPHWAPYWPNYSPGLCPVREAIQPRILMFKTNYFDTDEAVRQADILAETIRRF